MTDEQCNALIDAIKDLTSAVHNVAENIDNLPGFNDNDLIQEVKGVRKVLEDINEWKL